MTETWVAADAAQLENGESLDSTLPPTRFSDDVGWAPLALIVPCGVALMIGSFGWQAFTPGSQPLYDIGALVSVVVLFLQGQFQPKMVPDFTSTMFRVMRTAAVSVVVVAAAMMSGTSWELSVRHILTAGLVVCGAMLIGTFVGSYLLRKLWLSGRMRTRAIIVGSGSLAREVAIEIEHQPTFGVDVVGFVADRWEPSPIEQIAPHLGGYDELPEIIDRTGSHRLIVSPLGGEEGALVHALRRVNVFTGVDVFVVPRFFELGMGADSLSPDRVRGFPLMRLSRSANPRLGRLAKRAFDAAAAFVALLVLSPLMLVTAVAVKVTSRGPVFYTQERITKGNRPFTLYKFRSMTQNDQSDVEWTADDRVTAVGRIIRPLAIDELPQFWNVLIGDMSLVGPRPMRPAFIARFATEIPDFRSRHRVRTGLTGLAQIVGLRGDTSVAERAKYDNLYIDQWTFTDDLQILVKTLWAIVRQGSYTDRQSRLETRLSEFE